MINMKKYLSLVFTLVVALFAANSFAYTSPPAPAHGGYVLDETSKLSQTEIDQLNRKIESIKQSTKNEYGIALIQSTGGEDIADVGQTIFRAWGIGDKKLNNGVLLVIAMAEHKTRIQTGKGVEGDLPDLKANDILNKTLKPLLRQGKFYDGINATLDAIASSVDSRAQTPSAATDNAVQSTTAQNTQAASSDGTIIFLVIFGFVGIVGLSIFLAVRRAKKEKERFAQLELAGDREAERLRRIRQTDEQRLRNQNLTTSPEVPNKKSYFDSYAPSYAPPVTAATLSATKKREDDARRRRKEEEDTKKRHSSSGSSYSSSSSSYESSGGSWSSGGGGFDGGGFSGGDSGGGGSSGGW